MEFIKHLGITKAVKVAETFLRFSLVGFLLLLFCQFP